VEITLNIQFNIPAFHESLITSAGEIFMIGGSLDQKTKIDCVFIYDFENKNLIRRPNMSIARSSFSACYCNDYIYALGGITDNGKFTSSCERFSLKENKWESIDHLNLETAAHCSCIFNKKFIFRFGGYLETQQINNFIERYDIQ